MDERQTNKLADFLIKKASEEWKANGQDYHLARVAPEFKGMYEESYKNYLGDFEKLKDFAGSISELYVNQDPNARAKIGIRPIGEKSVVQNITAERIKSDRSDKSEYSRGYSRSERSIIYFLRLLSDLPEDELQKIEIPASALAKLVKK